MTYITHHFVQKRRSDMTRHLLLTLAILAPLSASALTPECEEMIFADDVPEERVEEEILCLDQFRRDEGICNAAVVELEREAVRGRKQKRSYAKQISALRVEVRRLKGRAIRAEKRFNRCRR